jgi:hypothetical protein
MDTSTTTRRTTARRAPAAPVQPALPFDVLTFDDEADRPVALALTARALRTVAPAAVPVLRVLDGGAPGGRGAVTDDASADDPADTRPARARALCRAGLGVEEISARLGVDGLLVQAWTRDVPSPQRRRTGRRPRGGTAASARAGAHPAAGPRSPEHVDAPDPVTRRAARDEAATRLPVDPDFAVAVGTLAGAVEIEGAGAILTTTRQALASSVMDHLARFAGLTDAGVRVVLRVGPAVPADRARHEWAAALGVSLDRVATARWPAAVTDEAVEATVRVTDPAVVARLVGWSDALLDPRTPSRRDGSA